MNIRSLTRGDGVVIGAAVLLFIASFLDLYSVDGAPDDADLPSAWASGPVVMGVVLAGIIGAALVVLSRGLPQLPKVAGLDLGQVGAAFTVFAAWSALGNVFDPLSAADYGSSSNTVSAGIGLILALVATLVMAAAAVATPLVPALQAGLVPAPKPPQPQPYGAQPPGGYGYPGAQQPGQQAGPQGQPYGGQPQPGQPFGAQPQPQAQAPQPCGRGVLAVLVRRAGAAPAVRGGRFADADRRTRPGHLVPGRRAARSGSGRPDAGRPSWRAAGHERHPARLSPSRS